jgi:hypothetical protein
MLIGRNIDAQPRMLASSVEGFGAPPMMDFIFIAAIVGFFVVSVGLVRFCAGLMSKGGRP